MYSNEVLLSNFITYTMQGKITWKLNKEDNFYNDDVNVYRSSHKIGRKYFEYYFYSDEYPYFMMKCWDRFKRIVIFEKVIRGYDGVIESRLEFLGDCIVTSVNNKKFWDKRK